MILDCCIWYLIRFSHMYHDGNIVIHVEYYSRTIGLCDDKWGNDISLLLNVHSNDSISIGVALNIFLSLSPLLFLA